MPKTMRFDLHAHTNRSIDGARSPATMVRAAKEKGLDGIAITDHDSVAGWKEAEKAGKECGIIVIRGEEITVYKGKRPTAHVLGLFLKKSVKAKTMPEVAEEIHRQGGLAVAAHPLDRWRGRYAELEKYIGYFDAIEVMNSHTPFWGDNRRAREFARKNRKAVTGGSDAHIKHEVGFCYTEAKARNLAEFKKALLNGETEAYGRKTEPIYHVFALLSKIGLYPRDK